MTIQDDVLAESDPKERARLKVLHLRDLFNAEWDANGSVSVDRTINGRVWRVTFQQKPTLVRDKQDNIIGVAVYVRVYRQNLQGVFVEQQVDGRRAFINPPLMVPTGNVDGEGNPTYTLNPRKALLDALMDSIRDKPNAAGWVAP